jgi:hypothetical protein
MMTGVEIVPSFKRAWSFGGDRLCQLVCLDSLLDLALRQLSASAEETVREELKKTASLILLWTPGPIFISQILFTAISTGLTLGQKFAEPPADSHLCSLQSSDEDAWGFGQILPMLLLVLPVFSALDAYVEERVSDKERTITHQTTTLTNGIALYKLDAKVPRRNPEASTSAQSNPTSNGEQSMKIQLSITPSHESEESIQKWVDTVTTLRNLREQSAQSPATIQVVSVLQHPRI